MRELARIIDANANRAGEALRTLEDLARFAANDVGLSAELKSMRHALRGAIEGLRLPPGLPLAARDTPGDVGTAISTPEEGVRVDATAIARAAARRLQEALRSIEECAKTVSAEAGRPFESLRYRSYDAERRLAMRLTPREQWRLCVLLTASLCRRPWEDVALAAIRGGADCLQLREKDLPDAELLARAKRLVALARETGGVRVIINDRPDIALLAGADGVHLGQEDLPPARARAVLGCGAFVGVSTADMEQAAGAAAGGAGYCGVGPMFQTRTKHKPVLAGPEYLARYLEDERTREVPHLAIGGIDAENARRLADAGCRGVAVSAAVCTADDPERAASAIRGALGD